MCWVGSPDKRGSNTVAVAVEITAAAAVVAAGGFRVYRISVLGMHKVKLLDVLGMHVVKLLDVHIVMLHLGM